MTNAQQALIHLAIVVLVVLSVVALAITGHLTTDALAVILAVAGISSTGVAGIPNSPAVVKGTTVTTTASTTPAP